MWGRKFDIRLWVLVTSTAPTLCVWGFSDCYLRLSSKVFSLENLDDRMVHLCNFSVQKDSLAAAGEEAAAEEFQSGTGPDVVENMVSARSFAIWVDATYGAGSWTEIVQSMRSLVLETLLAGRSGLKKRERGFEWLGFDIMVAEIEHFPRSDANVDAQGQRGLRAYLIEANTSPDVSHSSPITAALVPAATEDLFRLILDEHQADAVDTTVPLSNGASYSSDDAARLPARLSPRRKVGYLFETCKEEHAAAVDPVPTEPIVCDDAPPWAQVPGFPDRPCWQLWYVGDGSRAVLSPPLPLPLVSSRSRNAAAEAEAVAGGGGTPKSDPPPPRSLRDLIRILPALKAAPSVVSAARAAISGKPIIPCK